MQKTRAAASRRSVSGGFQTALGQYRGNGVFLDLDADARGDFDTDETFAEVFDSAGDDAVGHHFIALGKTGQ